jgi:hypothetical protein
MGFFSSWWERVPLRQIGAVLTVVALLGFVVQFNGRGQTTLFPFKGNAEIERPTGQVWD